ncbi:hypothetical protein B0H12DRAFT_589937 [Mycena haematopus]|nr:hypothetical protein B0H12DRAFT_589937 [Mycena haematopus]
MKYGMGRYFLAFVMPRLIHALITLVHDYSVASVYVLAAASAAVHAAFHIDLRDRPERLPRAVTARTNALRVSYHRCPVSGSSRVCRTRAAKTEPMTTTCLSKTPDNAIARIGARTPHQYIEALSNVMLACAEILPRPDRRQRIQATSTVSGPLSFYVMIGMCDVTATSFGILSNSKERLPIYLILDLSTDLLSDPVASKRTMPVFGMEKGLNF